MREKESGNGKDSRNAVKIYQPCDELGEDVGRYRKGKANESTARYTLQASGRKTKITSRAEERVHLQALTASLYACCFDCFSLGHMSKDSTYILYTVYILRI